MNLCSYQMHRALRPQDEVARRVVRNHHSANLKNLRQTEEEFKQRQAERQPRPSFKLKRFQFALLLYQNDYILRHYYANILFNHVVKQLTCHQIWSMRFRIFNFQMIVFVSGRFLQESMSRSVTIFGLAHGTSIMCNYPIISNHKFDFWIRHAVCEHDWFENNMIETIMIWFGNYLLTMFKMESNLWINMWMAVDMEFHKIMSQNESWVSSHHTWGKCVPTKNSSVYDVLV